ncbi:MAG: hypothetical protein DWB42_06110 [Chloroflexi bacterium]|nr:hypothetical protein [Chloroflexota bacterium]MDL1884400.1 hypothetical protein [Anaerolineae bacterium CFX8]
MRRYRVLFALVMLACFGVVSAAPLPQQISDFSGFVLNTRADLEQLANAALGEGARPEGWTFNINNVGSPTFIADLWFDNELLATVIFGEDRPPGWIGAPTTQNPLLVVRNIRHDLELSADEQFGIAERPAGWRGGPAVARCDRAVQNLVQILVTAYTYNFQTNETALNYCATIAAEAEQQVLLRVLSTPEYQAELNDLTLAVRGDLERLADEELGLNNRPADWRGSRDITIPTFLSDLFLDLDTLANTQLGLGVRPAGWIGVLPNAPALAYRNLRHDLELLSNELGRVPRPRGWQGIDPLAACDPNVQSLVLLAQQSYGLAVEEIGGQGAAFCAQASQAANQIVESPPKPEVVEGEAAEDDTFIAESDYAFSYLDSAATQYMGIMPPGTKFKAWYRNFGDSTMMFVSGEEFAVYVDLRWTTLSPDIFTRLPTLEGVKPLTFCDARWCNGPAPTPTPTGAGALQALLNAGTPQAVPSVEEVRGEKTQVSWNNIRVTYLLDNPNTRTAQVALEICTDTTQTACEPVLQIFDNATGALKPVLSQYNGLNVFEFPYGYTANLVIEGSTLFSPDIWISDPTIR